MSRRQEEFLLAADSRINILTGSVRSGKTWASLMKWALFVAGSPVGSEFLMAGNTGGTLERNCLNTLTQIAGAGNFNWNRQTMRGELFGRRVWFVGAGDAACEGKIRGMTLAGAYLDELTLLRKDFFMTLLSRLSVPGALLYATTNPDAPGHWVMTDVIKNPKMGAVVWDFALEDNVFLPEEYVKAVKDEFAGVFYERYVLGQWTACEGAVYRRFVESRKDFFAEAENVGTFDTISVGVDFGGSRSAHAFVACGVRDERREARDERVLYALASRRLVGEDVDPDRLYDEVGRFLEFVAKRYGAAGRGVVFDVYCDSAEPVLIRGLRRALSGAQEFTARVRSARKRRIIDRIRAAVTFMARSRFFYTADCATLENALLTAVWKSDGERLDDGTVDVDTLDAFEYAWEREIGRDER